jgi:hypothetical protein
MPQFKSPCCRVENVIGLFFVTTTTSLKRMMLYSHREIADICTYLHAYDSSSRNSRASDTGCKSMDLSAV